MPLESNQISEYQNNQQEEIELFFNHGNIQASCKNYVEKLINQGCNGKELEGKISSISKLLDTQNGENLETNKQLLETKEQLPHTFRQEQKELQYEISGSYFGVSTEFIQLSDTLEKEMGINLNDLCIQYHQYLVRELSGENNSEMIDENHALIIEKIKKSISIKILSIGEIYEELKIQEISENDDLNEIQSKKWVLNSRIQEHLSFMNNELLPSIKAYIQIKSGQKLDYNYQDQFLGTGSIKDGTKYENDKYVNLDSKLEEIEELFTADIDKNGNFSENILGLYTQNILNSQNTSDNFMLKELGVKPVEISILSENEKEVEKTAMKYYCGAIAAHIAIEMGPAALASIVPGAGTAAGALVGSIAGAGIDITDTFSNRDALMTILRASGKVPENYQIDKTWLDNMLSGLSIVPLMTPVVKGKKLAALIKKFNISGDELVQSMQDILPYISQDRKTIQSDLNVKNINSQNKSNDVKKTIDKFQSQTSEKIDEILSGKSELTDDLVREIASIENDKERIFLAEKILGKNISPELSEKLVKVHEASDANVFEHTFSDNKIKLLKAKELSVLGEGSEQIQKNELKKLMDWGVLGKVEMPDFPEGFLKRFLGHEHVDRNIISNLRTLPIKLGGEMDYNKMKEFVRFMRDNPNLFPDKRGIPFLEYRIGILDDLKNPQQIKDKFGKISDDRVNNIIQNLDKKLFLKNIIELKKDIKSKNSNIAFNKSMETFGIKLGPVGGDPRADFLYWVSKRELTGSDPVKDAMLQRVTQVEHELRRLLKE